MPDPITAVSEWITTAIDSTQAAWVLAVMLAAVPFSIAAAWLIDHLPTRTTTTKGNHHV